MSLTITDLFCGAGGSSLGAEMAGAELKLGLNHWRRAIETHAANFPHGDHDCADISALTTSQIRRYPHSDILLASPECTNHSLAKGAKRVKPQAASLWEDGPAGDEEQDRSRATMWDVVRFAEQKLLAGHPYKAIVVENVPDAFKWGYADDGALFDAWRQAVNAVGYEHEIVWLNSMFCPPTPQSRDRMYVVFWLKGARKPNLKITPPSWCPSCSKIVGGVQTWKKPGGRVWGKYGPQYVYGCPECQTTVLPGVFPAATAIDWSLTAGKIGERTKPLAEKTIERIRRGLERLSGEPFAFRLLQAASPRPLTLPFITLTQRHDLGMVIPVAGNTFERTPGNRARDPQTQPMDTLHGTLDRALIVPPMGDTVPFDADVQALPTLSTTTRAGLVQLQNHGDVIDPTVDPAHSCRAGGFHHGVVVANYRPGWAREASEEPFGSITTTDGHSLVIPYDRTGQPRITELEPTGTLSTRDRVALLVPPKDPGPPPEPREWSDSDIDECGFRMFDLHEIARTMAMDTHKDGSEYVVTGNKRERMAQYGNAVTPPAMRTLVGRIAESLDEAA